MKQVDSSTKHKLLKLSTKPAPGKVSTWFDTRAGCITAIAVCFAFIAVFVANIIINQNWLNIIFIVLYGAIIRNRLKRLRSMVQ